MFPTMNRLLLIFVLDRIKLMLIISKQCPESMKEPKTIATMIAIKSLESVFWLIADFIRSDHTVQSKFTEHVPLVQVIHQK